MEESVDKPRGVFAFHFWRISSRPNIDASRTANSGRHDYARQSAAHIRELSSDAYGGRFPGTPGEEKSVAYVISQIKAIGLQPGTPAGGLVQNVPLYGARSPGAITITAVGRYSNVPV